MEVKGNFIVQGSYIDIHDNEVVNLSVDKAEVKVNGKTVEKGDSKSMANNDTEQTSPSLVSCIEKLMVETNDDGSYLFSKGNHWIAIFRIVADRNLVAENDYKGFYGMIDRLKPEGFRIPLKIDNLKTIAKSNFGHHFDKWHYDKDYNKTRKPFDDMVNVASRFKEILEENGL